MLLAWIGSLTCSATHVVMTSPDGQYAVTLSDENQLTYQVSYQGETIIRPSRLGIKWNETWDSDIRLGAIKTWSCDSIWHPVYGERSSIRENYNAWQLTLTKEGSQQQMAIEVRAYNEGIAFRYHFLGGMYLQIKKELTEFVMPEGTQAWHTLRAQTPYHLLPLKEWPGESDRPLLLRLPSGHYACLAEAAVVDYVRTKFTLSDTQPDCIVTSMYGLVEEIAPYQTPWRVVMCGTKAGEILEHNDLLLNLNPPSRIADTSWIKPGKVMREVTLTTEGGKALVDFAVKRNLQYIHFDAGWYGYEYDKASDATTVTLDPKRNPQPDALQLKEVIDYAHSKGIGVIVYVNQRALQQQLDEILPLYKSWGIAGIKFGFVQVGSQVWTKWMHDAVAKCAAYGLIVDVHDEYRPTGVSRTWPNLMTQEGIRGNEEFPDATHNVTLPFTRFVAGAADYTICYYRQEFDRLQQQGDNYGVPRSRSIRTTPAHQLALSVVFYSPLQYMYWYDKPSDSQDEPELKFFDDVYTVWDDTRVLEGEVGQFVVTARRHGDEWFVGGLTNNDARQLSIPLDFLSSGQTYLAEIYTDGDPSIPTRTKVKVSQRKVDSRTKLSFSLKPSGGVAIRLVPVQP